jgi:hypothetical protein
MSVDALYKMERWDELCKEMARREARPHIDPNLSEDDMLQEARIAVIDNHLFPSLAMLPTSTPDPQIALLTQEEADEVLQRRWIKWRLLDYTKLVMRQRRGQTGWDTTHELHS